MNIYTLAITLTLIIVFLGIIIIGVKFRLDRIDKNVSKLVRNIQNERTKNL